MDMEIACLAKVAGIHIPAVQVSRNPEEYENYHMNGRTRPAGKSVCIFYILNNSFHIFISPQKDGS